MWRRPVLSKQLIGELLVARWALERPNLLAALKLQKDAGGSERLGAILARQGWVAEPVLYQALSEQLGIPLATAEDYPALPIFEERVSTRFLQEARALPVHEDADRLVLAMADPLDHYVIPGFRVVTGREIGVLLGLPGEIDAAFERPYVAGGRRIGAMRG